MLFFLACVKLKAHRVFSLQAEVVHVSMCIIIKQTFQNDHELHHLVLDKSLSTVQPNIGVCNTCFCRVVI